jgi:uncharacterized membrane protein YqjE
MMDSRSHEETVGLHERAGEPPPPNMSMIDLFSRLVDQMSMLFRKEIELARAEMSEKASDLGSGLIKAAVGAVLMIPALVILLHAVVAWLDEAGLEPRWGYLIVGVIVSVIGAALLQSGVAATRTSNLTPHRTAEQLQRDAAVAREQIR